MEIRDSIVNGKLKIKVIPNSSQQKAVFENNQWKIYLHTIPDKNKANRELIQFFKKQFGLRVEIISGMKSREKTLRVL